ncbi:MAG TPA: DUF494 family protein [Gemmatimonadaceae bacterium]|nr:DUF494 family protein [Gemmatimonadaceae bacterium]
MATRFAAILAALRRRFPDGSHVAEVEAYLSSEGYDRQQIGAILSHLAAHDAGVAEGTGREAPTPGTFRVMGPHEWGRFAPEAWGYLLELSDSGALMGTELEQLIERALAQFDGRISLEDLRALMEGAGLDESGSGLDQVNVH